MLRGKLQIIAFFTISIFGLNPAIGETFRPSEVSNLSEPLTCNVKIIDSEGKPVPAAEVVTFLQSVDLLGEKLDLENVLESTANNQGEFLLTASEKKANSVYVIAARKLGYAIGWASWDVQSSQTIEIVLDKPAILAGEVVEEKALVDTEVAFQKPRPIADAEVRLILMPLRDEGKEELAGISPFDWLLTRTDSEGRFKFDNIPPDTNVNLLVSAPGRARIYDGNTVLGSWRGRAAGTTDVCIFLPPPSVIKGNIVDARTQKPLSGVRLLLERQGRPLAFTPFTGKSDADGNFLIKGMEEGKYYIRVAQDEKEPFAWATSPLKVDAKIDGDSQPVKLEFLHGGSIEIAARDADTNEPIRNAMVFWGKAGDKHYPPRTYTGADGVARMRVMPGEYRFSVDDPSRYHFSRFGKHVRVVDGTAERFEVKLQMLPTAKGFVYDMENKPVANATASIMPGGGNGSLTDKFGGFEIKWNPTISKDQILLVRERYRGLVGAVKIIDKCPARVQLGSGVAVTGKVIDHEGKVPNRVRIDIYIWTGSKWVYTIFGGLAWPDKTGQYKIKSLPAGQKYRISITPEGYAGKQIEIEIKQDGPKTIQNIDFNYATAG